MTTIRFGDRPVGSGHTPYVIAEIGANHNGDMDLCRRTIDAAKACGADAAKFQSWSTSSILSQREFDNNPTYSDKKRHFGSLREMVEAYQLTPAQHHEVKAYCDEVGIHFMSSAFSPQEVDLLHSLEVPAFKIASMDVTHLPLLKHIGRKRRPVILSTGMAELGEIERAIGTLEDAGASAVVVLHCISVYPAPPSIMNMRNIATFARVFDRLVGFSDHTLGVTMPIVAATLGACVIEKHFTLDKGLPGWDHHMSADPSELKALVDGARDAQAALGSAQRVVGDAEMAKRMAFRRRVVARHPMKAGAVLREEDLDFKRPGNGIGPDELAYIVGRTLARDVEYDEWLEWEDVGAPGKS
ncbi:MAG: N-acetylneuraminate synthase family protein [Myxococcota bacterium]|nr:N-acetylneuraminate synthase family protein [Myxococcota bacterium]